MGALLGLAIGDALGMPVEGWSRARIAERYGRIDGYRQKTFADGAEIKAGEFTDESDFALCIVEAITADQGRIDPDVIGARFARLARTEAKRWIAPATLAAIEAADAALRFEAPLDEDGPATGDVAARGVPIGLLYAVGRFDAGGLRADAERVTRLTHGSPAAIAATTAVAFGVNLAARGDVPRPRWASETAAFLGGGELAARLDEAAAWHVAGTAIPDALTHLGTGAPAAESVASAFYAATAATVFEEAVFEAVNAGGDTDTVGGIAGALAGAAGGAGGIPQGLIDGAEGRIYVSLAAPWFYRTALRRAGLVIDLRPSGPGDSERPAFPPRV